MVGINRVIVGIEQKIIKYFWNKEDNNLFFLMFHEVINKNTDNPLGGWNFTISLEKFECLICTLAEKTKYLSITAAVQQKVNGGIVITFDDVYHSVVENAIPFLINKEIPFVLFVSPGLIDKQGYITSDELKQLAREPLCTIGYHSKEHIGMRFFHGKDEIIGAATADEFQEKNEIECKYFAYPYGSVYMCPKRVRKIVSKLNYEAAFGTVHSGTNGWMMERNRYYIPRLNVSEKSCNDIIHLISFAFRKDR